MQRPHLSDQDNSPRCETVMRSRFVATANDDIVKAIYIIQDTITDTIAIQDVVEWNNQIRMTNKIREKAKIFFFSNGESEFSHYNTWELIIFLEIPIIKIYFET